MNPVCEPMSPIRVALRRLAPVALGAVLGLGAIPASAQDRPAAPPAASPPAAGSTAPAARAGDAAPAIGAGSTVRIEYTLKDAAGAVLDSTRDREPLRYVHGQEDILPGLERALEGLRAGAETKVILTPDEAYGYVDPEAQTEIPREMIPAAAAVVGTRLTARNQEGAARQVMVKEIRDRTIVLDMNHPLAGKTLVFEVKVVEVKAAEGGAAPSAPPAPGATPRPAAPPAGRPGR